MALKAKGRNKLKLVEYIGDPKNDFPDRTTMALTVLGYSKVESLYRHFSPDELSAIEDEGLQLRRKKYAPELSRVDRGLLKKASEGDSKSAKLCYQRFEGWAEKTQIDVGVTIGDVLAGFPPEVQKMLKEAMAKKIG